MMNYKLLICLLSVFMLSPIRASIYEVFDLKDLPASSSAEGKPVIIGNPIAQKIIADNPRINFAAKIFKRLQLEEGSGVYSVAWRPDGKQLASGLWYGNIVIWDLVSGLSQTLKTLTDDRMVYLAVAWSSNGTRLASVSGNKTIIIWNLVDGSLQRSQLLTGHESSLYSVAWSPDGTKLASGSGDNTIKMWDTVSGSSLQTLQGHTGPVNSVAWSPDGTKLASGSGDNTIKIWDAVSGSLLQALQGHMGSVNSVAWSPDGTELASGSWDKTIKIWSLVGDSLQLSQTLTGHTEPVRSVAWSPDGIRVASGSMDKAIKIWSLVDGSLQLSQTLTGHAEGARSVAWSPDGTKVAFGSINAIGIWDLYLLNATDIENITLEQALLLKLFYEKWPTYAHTRMKPIDLNVPLHDQLPVEEAQQILSTFSDEARNRIIERYNIVGYTSSPKRENDENAEESPRIRHHGGSADAASSSADAMKID